MDSKTVKVTLPSGEVKSIPYGTPCASLTDSVRQNGREVIAFSINNKVYSQEKELVYDAVLSPVYLDTKDGSAIYRRSLCLLLASAAYNLYPSLHLLVGHSLGYSYYYTFDNLEKYPSDSVESIIKNIEIEMQRLVKEDLKIETCKVPYKEACDIFSNNGLTQTRELLNYKCPPYLKINRLCNFTDLYFGPLSSSTGILKTFSLMQYKDGFLLRFPPSSTPYKLKPFEDQPKLFEVYKRYKKWGERLQVTSVSSLNSLIVKQRINDFIDITETLQEKCISDIASAITKKESVKVVLIAGPSSSGKTTTSKKLALELQAIGWMPKVISLDCYYAGHDRTPRDKDGNLDFECLEALDIELLNKNLIDLFNGKEAAIPSYDFLTGKQYFEKEKVMKLHKNDILIMEGIHGLNDRLTPLIPNELKFKIYLSALTQLNLDCHNRISTSDNRLIRRIVRDYQFRGKSAGGTIKMWPQVRRGEEEHIFPYQNNADAILNTALDYELSVLKVYATPLLRCVTPLEDEYNEACVLLNFLDNFATIDPVNVPSRSIIREFIGGSVFKY